MDISVESIEQNESLICGHNDCCGECESSECECLDDESLADFNNDCWG